MGKDRFQVFQIKPEDDCYRRWGKTYEQQVKDGFMIRSKNYKSAYKSMIAPLDTPDSVRKRLEEKHPNTFVGRPFGVSDVIVWSKDDTLRFYYVDKDCLVEFGGFMLMTGASGSIVMLQVSYQVDGKNGSWLAVDSEVVDGTQFYMLRSEQYGEKAADIVVDEKCQFVAEATKGFDEPLRNLLAEHLKNSRVIEQTAKPELLHHQKYLENGTYERAQESGTEQNYNMVDGCANNVPEKPRVINGRTSVLDRLHIKQAQRAKGKNGQTMQMERNRK